MPLEARPARARGLTPPPFPQSPRSSQDAKAEDRREASARARATAEGRRPGCRQRHGARRLKAPMLRDTKEARAHSS